MFCLVFLVIREKKTEQPKRQINIHTPLHAFMYFLLIRPPRRRSAAVPRHPGPAGGGEQAAVLPPVATRHGASSSAVQCVCRTPRQGRPPGGDVAAFTAQQGAAEHENPLVGLPAS